VVKEMRITYYSFPVELPIRERVLAYKQIVEGKDIIEIPEDISDEVLDRNFPIEFDCSVSTAKKLLKKFGGNACTQHFDRDGGLFETTPILLKSNNSKFKYNHHL